jgi:glutathione-independent formaldehyde dehydrogenase
MGSQLAKGFVQSKLDSGSPTGERDKSKRNLGIVYNKDQHLEVRDTGYPTFKSPVTQENIDHGVIVKVIASALCGSDCHIVRGRHMETKNLILGHEFTGEVVEKGTAVHKLNIGDIVSVPFNIGCGTCRHCEKGYSNLCPETNDLPVPGAAYGYPCYGGWQGGQAEFTMVPYAEYNCLKISDFFLKAKLWDRILDIALLTDVLGTAMNGAVEAKVGFGKSVCVVGAGPVGLACAKISYLMGASEIFLADVNPDRLIHAKKYLKCHTLDWSKKDCKTALDEIKKVLGQPNVDCGIDCVGYEAKQSGTEGKTENPAEVLNLLAEVVCPGGYISVPGAYMAPDPKGVGLSAKQGYYSLAFALMWLKAVKIVGTGQAPIKKFNRKLMEMIMHDRLSVAQLLNVQVIPLQELPKAYEEFAAGAPVKWIVDVNGYLSEYCDELLRQRKLEGSDALKNTKVNILPNIKS